MQRDWFTKRLTVDEAEAAHAVTDDRLGPDPIPFGFLNDRWQELLAQMQPGDELWQFNSPKENWQGLAGRAGISLVRDGKVIDSLVTCMS
jgi:hypothetical protein